MATLKTKIVLRNDTAEKWLASNPVLLAGEMGVETDTGLLKVGDGTSTWAALEYINKFENVPTATHYEGTAQPIEGSNPVEYESDEMVMARVLGEAVPQLDDVFIVKRPITADRYSHTAYVFNGTAWAAMDGNYNADNVYFDSDLLATAPIGVVTIPETGSATIAAEGKNLSSVLASILAERKDPEVEDPNVKVSFSNATKSVEAGTTITPSFTASLEPGSYSYGPATGVVATAWSVKDNRPTPETLTVDSGSFSDIRIGDQTGDVSSYSITATATYGAGAIPVDNFGDPVEALQIAAGEDSTTVTTKITCFRNYFYGVLSTSSAEEPLTSAVIREKLTAGGAYNGKKTFAMDANSVDEAKRMVIAYPANTTRGGLESVILPNSLQYDAFANGDYKHISNVNVEGAEGYAAIAYTVYVYEPAVIDSTEIHNVTLA